MKILVFADYFYPHKGGLENYVYETSKRLVNSGHKVDVVTASLPGSKHHEIYKGIGIFRMPTWHMLGGTYPVPLPGIFFFLKRHKDYDLVITHTRFFPISFVGARHAKKYGIPHLHIEHGTIHPTAKWYLAPVIRAYDHTLGWYVLHSAEAVAGVSKSAENFVNHICKRPTELLYNSVDTFFFKKVPAKKKWKGNVITFVGRLIEAKGVQDLLDATKDIRDITVLIIGSGNYESELKRKARNKVKFLGEKNPEKIREILSVSDIFVNPSYAEGLPTSVLEAGAMGVPVIATDVGGTREIIDSGKNGFLIKPRDVKMMHKRIKQVLNDPPTSIRMGVRLQDKIRAEFDWDVTCKKLIKLTEKISGKK